MTEERRTRGEPLEHATMTNVPGDKDFIERRRVIHVAGRRRSTVPWVLGAAMIVALLVVLWPQRVGGPAGEYTVAGANDAAATAVESGAADADSVIGDFARFVSGRRTRDVLGPRHEYTAEGIRRLAAAIAAVTTQDSVAVGALEPRIQALRLRAEALQRDPKVDTHALRTREAFLLAASILNDAQDRRFPHLDGDAATVRRAAESIVAGEALTKQADAVERFFERSAHLLRAMVSVGE
jgi:hypothetical protein